MGCFIRLLVLAPRLAGHRIGVPTKRQFWTSWLPGDFTPEGELLRGKITRSFIVGWIFLALGFWLGRSPAV
jgi:hypothetical protein